MADGAITLILDEALSEKLERRAAAAGLSHQALAEQLLAQSLFDYDDYTWIGDDPRDRRDDEPSGYVSEGRPWEDVKRDLRAQLEARLAAKR